MREPDVPVTLEEKPPSDPPSIPPETSEHELAHTETSITDYARLCVKAAQDDGYKEIGTVHNVSFSEAYQPVPEPSPPAKPAGPPLLSQEEYDAKRAARNVEQLIRKEQARLTPLARRAFLCALHEACTKDIASLDESYRRALAKKEELLAKARSEASPEKVSPDPDASPETAGLQSAGLPAIDVDESLAPGTVEFRGPRGAGKITDLVPIPLTAEEL